MALMCGNSQGIQTGRADIPRGRRMESKSCFPAARQQAPVGWASPRPGRFCRHAFAGSSSPPCAMPRPSRRELTITTARLPHLRRLLERTGTLAPHVANLKAWEPSLRRPGACGRGSHRWFQRRTVPRPGPEMAPLLNAQPPWKCSIQARSHAQAYGPKNLSPSK